MTENKNQLTDNKQVLVKTGRGEFLFVEVPQKFISPVIIGNSLRWKDKANTFFWDQVILTPGNFTLLCTSKGISEEDYKKIGDTDCKLRGKYFYLIYGKVYDPPDHARIISTQDWQKAFSSLLKFNNLDENKCYAVLQKQNL